MSLALDYSPPPGDAGVSLARIADVRLRASRSFGITKVTSGDALTASGKQLFVDPATNQPWRLRADGAVQMLVESVASANDLTPGRIATLDVTYDGAQPVELWLVRRDAVFAPASSDNELQASPYDTPVTVSR
jgi:hypothetical protein